MLGQLTQYASLHLHHHNHRRDATSIQLALQAVKRRGPCLHTTPITADDCPNTWLSQKDTGRAKTDKEEFSSLLIVSLVSPRPAKEILPNAVNPISPPRLRKHGTDRTCLSLETSHI